MDKKEKRATIKALAEQLATGLQGEREALNGIKLHVDRQLSALRQQDREIIEDTTLLTSQEINSLQKLRNQREQIISKMARLLNLSKDKQKLKSLAIALATELPDRELKANLAELAAELPEDAASVKESCKELAYSLQYALHLGQSLIEAIHGATSPPPVQIYTATGNKKLSSNRRMMINKVG